MGIKEALQKVSERENLTFAEAKEAMDIIMTGEATQAQIGAYLMGLRLKGETVDEIAGSAVAMREASNVVSVSAQRLVDTCGTGGDGAHTFNISTTVAFVVAGVGIPVAKHGNRSVSSKSGSADVLRELGVNIEITPDQSAECIDEVGIGFLFAPAFHPAMKHAIGPRREMGVRTIFNILGPLTNPAGAKRQLIGVYDPALTEPLAEVLAQLGSEAVLVVHGAGGLDELTTTGDNVISELRDGEVITYSLDSAILGLQESSIEELKGGEPSENAVITRDVLNNKGTRAQREIVLLNAAAALVAGGKVSDLSDGIQLAAKSIDSGAATETLNNLIEHTQKFKS